jgi:KDO2-lipid IV(A) lauroyltransferase
MGGKISTSKNATAKIDSDKSASGEIPLYRFWQPRYWLLWLGLVILRILVVIPFRQQANIGRMLGRLGLRLFPKRRMIAAANLSICFPELDQQALDKLLVQHFESLGIGLFDLAMSYWASDSRLEDMIQIDGLDNLIQPLKDSRNVIILCGHFAAAELTGRPVAAKIGELAAMYRPTRNLFVDQILRRGRKGSASILIPKDELRQLIRTVKSGIPVWYAADQSYNRKYHALVPFFGEPAMTNAALTHIARMTDALVVPYFPRRLGNHSGYYGKFLPALDNFPSADPAADAQRINKLLEDEIRLAPEQYYWVHRRFKNRPAPHPDPYANIRGDAKL